jgi:hypothetical protein
LTRASIDLRKSLAKQMDRRIKSGDDAVLDAASRLTICQCENLPRRLSIQNHIADCRVAVTKR